MTRVTATKPGYPRDKGVYLARTAVAHMAAAAEPADLVGVSCIARGADSVFAVAVLDVGGRLEVVLPSRNYRERKVKPDHAAQFDDLVARAAVVRVMDFDDAGREAYEAANEAVVGTCDRLIAVWDCQASEKCVTGYVPLSA